MKLQRKTTIDSEIPTSSMPDIIFMLLIFFMVTTVLREYSGLPISLPKAKRIEKLKSKRHTSHIWVSKDLDTLLKSFLSCKEIRNWEKPSDHVPLIVELSI